MSFILDALKKSEAERRHGEVPGLQNEPFSPPPRRRPLWPLLLTVALLLNGGVLGWWLFGKQAQPPQAAVLVASQDTGSPSTASLSHPQPTPVAAGNPLSGPPAAPASAEPAVASVVMPDRPLAAEPPVDQKRPAPPAEVPAASPTAVRVAAPRPAADAYPPLDELPASVRAGLPGFDLQLHFYTEAPERRLVRLNGLNLHEGENGGGLQVEEIAPEGVKLTWGGVRFFLPAGRR